MTIFAISEHIHRPSSSFEHLVIVVKATTETATTATTTEET
jgi:hypothetical protein